MLFNVFYFLLFLLGLGSYLVLDYGEWANNEVSKKIASGKEQKTLPETQKAINPSIPLPTAYPSPSPSPKPQVKTSPKPINNQNWNVFKKDEHTTVANFPPDNRMATVEELNIEINNYRTSHGIGAILTHSTLCSMAQIRANQLLSNGKLDDHAGFDPLYQSQREFQYMTEIIGGGIQPSLAVHLVEWGWGRSLTGHKEAMLSPNWTHGCAGIAGYFAVFVFGNN